METTQQIKTLGVSTVKRTILVTTKTAMQEEIEWDLNQYRKNPGPKRTERQPTQNQANLKEKGKTRSKHKKCQKQPSSKGASQTESSVQFSQCNTLMNLVKTPQPDSYTLDR